MNDAHSDTEVSRVIVYKCPEHGAIDGRAVRYESHSQMPYCRLCERDVDAAEYVPGTELDEARNETERMRAEVAELGEAWSKCDRELSTALSERDKWQRNAEYARRQHSEACLDLGDARAERDSAIAERDHMRNDRDTLRKALRVWSDRALAAERERMTLRAERDKARRHVEYWQTMADTQKQKVRTVAAERDRLASAAWLLLAAYESEESEHGFPFNFALRRAHNELRDVLNSLSGDHTVSHGASNADQRGPAPESSLTPRSLSSDAAVTPEKLTEEG